MDTPEAITDLRNLQIPRHRRVWKPFMEKYNCQTIAEIGVFAGENFTLMIEHQPQLAVAVDVWKNDGLAAHNDCGYSQKTLNHMYKDFTHLVANKPFVLVCRDYSSAAANRFPDEFFDLIYIDADHTYTGCLADLESWYPKVKTGKFLTGDDYWHNRAPKSGVKFGVVEAVGDFAQKHSLTVYELPRHGWAMIK